MATQGVTTIDFGATGSDYLATVVTGQASISGTSDVEAYFMADSTTDNDEDAHNIAAQLVGLTAGSIVAGTGFTIYATCEDEIACGTFKVRWVYN